ncbi:hypothetical protein Y1Q_0018649 [Alligator mississippiensis]|uniref:Uncharacterized protein n=1 Tax=Alligator mississippiensis TaxID=8496 RepID=A0A151NRT5_ALLMI|nr:hypothetical protein Y1Q_0018649 [Alligator mississippiensis]
MLAFVICSESPMSSMAKIRLPNEVIKKTIGDHVIPAGLTNQWSLTQEDQDGSEKTYRGLTSSDATTAQCACSRQCGPGV